MSEPTEWISVRRDAKGNKQVVVSLVEGHYAVKWAAKTFRSTLKADVVAARKDAQTALDELKEAAG
jgi:hypothetical protein